MPSLPMRSATQAWRVACQFMQHHARPLRSSAANRGPSMRSLPFAGWPILATRSLISPILTCQSILSRARPILDSPRLAMPALPIQSQPILSSTGYAMPALPSRALARPTVPRYPTPRLQFRALPRLMFLSRPSHPVQSLPAKPGLALPSSAIGTSSLHACVSVTIHTTRLLSPSCRTNPRLQIPASPVPSLT